MNERIKELYDKVVGDDKLNLDSYLAEKFAQLIVRECVINALKESRWYLEQDELDSADACQNVALRLNKHFGV
jgi:hypothetical protein